VKTVEVRVYVAGRLLERDEMTIGGGDLEVIGALGHRHAHICRTAESEGLAWLIEVVFDDGEHVRWGTDAAGMVEPVPVDDIAEALLRRDEP
jgi:hypothetical protein